jgi:hypothetical protein
MPTIPTVAPKSIAAAFLFVGACLIVFAGWWAQNQLRLTLFGHPAEGVIVDVRWDRGGDMGGYRGGDHKGGYRASARFTTETGRVVTVRGSYLANTPAFTVGEPVRVVYDPDEPERAAIDGFAERWLIPLFFGPIGALFAALGGLWLAIGARRSSEVGALRLEGHRIQARVVGAVQDKRFSFTTATRGTCCARGPTLPPAARAASRATRCTSIRLRPLPTRVSVD